MTMRLVVEIFDGLWRDFGWWTAFGALIYLAYLPTQLAQNGHNKHENERYYRYRLGIDIPRINLMIMYLIVERLNDL